MFPAYGIKNCKQTIIKHNRQTLYQIMAVVYSLS